MITLQNIVQTFFHAINKTYRFSDR